MRIVTLNTESKKNILENLLKRSPNQYGEYEEKVATIIEEVREKKDQAVFEMTERFDGCKLDASNIRVTEEEIKEAYQKIDPELLQVIRKAIINIREFQKKQKRDLPNSVLDGSRFNVGGSLFMSGIIPDAVVDVK